nr:hypothetical protein SYMBAF_40022 [Serratia symbiotica]
MIILTNCIPYEGNRYKIMHKASQAEVSRKKIRNT